LTLSELVRLLQDLGVFVITILIAYVVYRIGVLVEEITSKIRREEDQLSKSEAQRR